jgi:hypothetical protein
MPSARWAAAVWLYDGKQLLFSEDHGHPRHRKGAYTGREAEWNRQEADIIAAGREGRVLDPDRISK